MLKRETIDAVIEYATARHAEQSDRQRKTGLVVAHTSPDQIAALHELRDMHTAAQASHKAAAELGERLKAAETRHAELTAQVEFLEDEIARWGEGKPRVWMAKDVTDEELRWWIEQPSVWHEALADAWNLLERRRTNHPVIPDSSNHSELPDSCSTLDPCPSGPVAEPHQPDQPAAIDGGRAWCSVLSWSGSRVIDDVCRLSAELTREKARRSTASSVYRDALACASADSQRLRERIAKLESEHDSTARTAGATFADHARTIDHLRTELEIVRQALEAAREQAPDSAVVSMVEAMRAGVIDMVCLDQDDGGWVAYKYGLGYTERTGRDADPVAAAMDFLDRRTVRLAGVQLAGSGKGVAE